MPTRTLEVAAPVGGWNVRDALENMPPEDAVELVNWFPSLGRVETRRGHSVFASGLGGAVETLAEFNAKTTRKFIAAADGKIWDVTTSPTSLATGFTNNRWQAAQFDDASGGARMALVNGFDAPQLYDGSTVGALTISGSGLTVSNLIGINIFKNRSYFWEKNSQDFWYSAVNALGGTLTKFPLGRVSGFGGNLVAMATWTIDGGDGVDDLAVFIMSSGDVIIYQGSDPSTASAWSLVGIFRLGAPMGVRAVAKIGSDLVLMTRDGYVPLSRILPLARSTAKGSLSDKINREVREVTDLHAENFGWQIQLYPRGGYLLFNIPISPTRFDQHIFNTATSAWCKFEGMNGICWSLFNDRLYFGGSDGKVYRADDGLSDNGAPITFSAQTAWNSLGARGQVKRMTAVRPMLESEGLLPVAINVGFDFSGAPNNYAVSGIAAATGAAWEVSDWDVSDWAGNSMLRPWVSAAGLGINVSTRLNAALSDQSCKWYSLQYLFEIGGLL
ncbi:MAG: hypothetical protein AB7U41_07475 [Dongiaceae bacterium]